MSSVAERMTQIKYDEGLKNGEVKIIKLMDCLQKDNRYVDAKKLLADEKYRHNLLSEYNIN